MGRLLDENNVYALFTPNGTARLHVADIDVLPRVDAVEVAHGRWIDIGDDDNSAWQCSNCKHTLFVWGERGTHCRFCGAKMDLEN